MKSPRLTAIPTNIITGFLGAGKTSTILHLLKQKPANERWAVLVNEFGQIGVDASLMGGTYSPVQNVFIREVPGGCMCCIAGVPMQVALNELLKEARPDRLLIEPTGLGHPKEVLKVLSASHYQAVLSLQKTITLVDARQLTDSRYTTHDIFNQQIAIADMVIGNKVDLYHPSDKNHLIDYVKKQGKNQVDVIFAQQGKIALSVLAHDDISTNKVAQKSDMNTDSLDEKSIDGPINHSHAQTHEHKANQLHTHAHTVSNSPYANREILISDLPIPACGFIKASNTGEGFYSTGWRFSIKRIFNYHKLLSFLKTQQADRIKGVFNTDRGCFGYNMANGNLTETVLADLKESRVEVIQQDDNKYLEAQLMACIQR